MHFGDMLYFSLFTDTVVFVSTAGPTPSCVDKDSSCNSRRSEECYGADVATKCCQTCKRLEILPARGTELIDHHHRRHHHCSVQALGL